MTDDDARALARELWARGHSLRHIAGRLGLRERTVLRVVGPRLVAARAARRGQ